MKLKIFVLAQFVVLAILSFSASHVLAQQASTNDSEQTLEGQIWEYSDYFYRGQRLPRPNSELHVRFYFVSENLLDLVWFRDNDEEFCHRSAQYIWKNNYLMQKIIWVDPKNTMGCSTDPDMQLNRESINLLELVNRELFLHLELNGEEFIYILKKINE